MQTSYQRSPLQFKLNFYVAHRIMGLYDTKLVNKTSDLGQTFQKFQTAKPATKSFLKSAVL